MYKILSGSSVIDVMDELSFVHFDPRSKTMLRCGEEDAQGILSSDASVIWHLEGYPKFGVSGYNTVSAQAVSKKEGEYLREQLKAGEAPEQPPSEGNEEPVMSMAEMRTEILNLRGQLTDAQMALCDVYELALGGVM